MRIRTFRVLAPARLGYRGAFLLPLALIDLVYGWFLINPTPEAERSEQFVWRDGVMPPAAWGTIWMVAGVILLVSAFLRRDQVGYAVAVGLKVGWAFVTAIGGIVAHTQGAWPAVMIWGGFAALTILESGRAEPLASHEVTVIYGDDDE